LAAVVYDCVCVVTVLTVRALVMVFRLLMEGHSVVVIGKDEEDVSV